jgi:hypothetical protein
VLVGEVPEKLLFEIWADDTDTIHIQKIKDLAPPVDEENIIKIKIRHSRNEVMDDND